MLERVAVERQHPREQLPQHDAVRVDVRLFRVGLLLHHFRRAPCGVLDSPVVESVDEEARREAEVGHLGNCLRTLVQAVEEDVGRLEVAVDDGRRRVVEEGHALSNVHGAAPAVAPGKLLLVVVDEVVEVAVVHELGHDAEGVHREAGQLDTVHVHEAAHDPHLPSELAERLKLRHVRERLLGALAEFDLLDGHHLVLVGALVDQREAALADLLLDHEVLVLEPAVGHVCHRHVGRQLVEADRPDVLALDHRLAVDRRLLAVLQREHEGVVLAVTDAVDARHHRAHVQAVPAVDQRVDRLEDDLRELRV
mmetsp:Transcript_5816/g.22677  ORF Transcript_5816/g.22677 Transcript_5816/m.22677 type:complete len:309 (+) Transcript_5816:476-1402(+)